MPKYTTNDIEILVATMHRTSLDFLYNMFPNQDFETLNLVVVNQTTEAQKLSVLIPNCKVINVFEKGLSRSRNLAISNAIKPILLLADDDVVYQKDFLNRCTAAGITKDRIQIQNMNGYDQSNWYWRKKKQEQPDMMASTTYIVKFAMATDIDRLVNTLDDNATQNMYISKTASSKMEEYRKDIKIKALQAAKAKAQYLCESIGEKIGAALLIKEVTDGGGYPQPMMERAMGA